MVHNFKNFRSGDSCDFFIEDSQYDNTYTCEIIFNKNGQKFVYTTDYSNSKFTLSLNSTESNKIKASDYKIYAIFRKVDYLKTVELTKITVLGNLLTSNCEEVESFNVKILRSINKIIEGRVLDDYDEYMIGNRSIKKMSIDKLFNLKKQFQDEVDKEENLKNGDFKGNKIKSHFRGNYFGSYY